jgi:hypothetical protein
MCYHYAIGVPLFSAGAFLFPTLKEYLKLLVEKNQVKVKENQLRVEIAKFELAKRCS